jgi:hypothetical protein
MKSTQLLPQLPREIWMMILKSKSKSAWKLRKYKIHKLLYARILPVEKHNTSFIFRGFHIWYYRTEHVDITIFQKRNEISLEYVLNVEVKEKRLINCVSLRFVYCPKHILL